MSGERERKRLRILGPVEGEPLNVESEAILAILRGKRGFPAGLVWACGTDMVRCEVFFRRERIVGF